MGRGDTAAEHFSQQDHKAAKTDEFLQKLTKQTKGCRTLGQTQAENHLFTFFFFPASNSYTI